MLYTEYVKESFDRTVLETEHGFITYQVLEGGVCHIDVLYVKPICRKRGVGTRLMDILMESVPECDLFICEVDLRSNNPTASVVAIASYGFKIYDTKDTYIRLMYKRGT